MLALAKEQGFAIRREGQTTKKRSRLVEREDGCRLASGKVEEFNSAVRRHTPVQKIDSAGSESPEAPVLIFQVARLIQHASFRTAAERHLPNSGLLKFGVVQEALVGRFNRVNAALGCDTHGRPTIERHFPQLIRSVFVRGIEINGLAVARPIGSAIVGLRERGDKTRYAAGRLHHVDFIKVLHQGFKDDVTAIRRPTARARYSLRRQLRAIGPVAIAHPNVALVAHSVRFEDDLLAVRGEARPITDTVRRQNSRGRTGRVPLVLEIEPPDGVPLFINVVSELVPSPGDRRTPGVLARADNPLRLPAGSRNSPEAPNSFDRRGVSIPERREHDFLAILRPSGIAPGIAGRQTGRIAAGEFQDKQVARISAHGAATESDRCSVWREGGVAIKLLIAGSRQRASAQIR